MRSGSNVLISYCLKLRDKGYLFAFIILTIEQL